MRTGIANLPLHWGSTPPWLFSRMERLARAIVLAMAEEFGIEEILKRLSDPHWFQSFGCLLGFDWHSSGLSTTVCSALKEALRGTEKDLGIFVAGGKGKTSRKAPGEIKIFGERFSLGKTKTNNLVYASKMSAKVDNSCLQDGFQIYHHSFIFTKDGNWTVVQQGMNPGQGIARRYHWLSDTVEDFVEEPHSAVCCDWRGKPLNLVAKKSSKTREISIELVRDGYPTLLKDIKKLKTLNMPRRHWIEPFDFNEKRMQKTISMAHEQKPTDFKQLVGIKGVGPKTLRAISLVSELIYGAKPSYEDPVKFAYCHGGKDGWPEPVSRSRYDASIDVLEKAVRLAKLGRREKLDALKRLSYN